jgi:hypothetical protein
MFERKPFFDATHGLNELRSLIEMAGMRRLASIALGLAFMAGAGRAEALTCARDDFARTVDQAGAALRKLNAENTPRLQAKMRQLKDAKGWPDAGYQEAAYEALQDERLAGFDAQANDLLAKLDTLGSVNPASEGDCAKLQELTATSLELQATIKAKTAYTLAKLDQMIAGPAAAPVATDAKSKPIEPPRKPAPAPQVNVKPAKPPQDSSWSTETSGDRSRDVAVAQPPVAPPPPARAPGAVVGAPEEEGYTIDEIMAASAGFFGKVSANLGAVIEHLFKNSGRPAGYVLGTEGGGAFLAGVRYGKGTLYMRSGGTHKVFWHGPSVGVDLGADGSKTLFLIYHLSAPDQLFANFTGVDGSAYLVGGVGATLMTNGSVIMAPIRSGMGLRLGANIGYVRFTPHATWNPF